MDRLLAAGRPASLRGDMQHQAMYRTLPGPSPQRSRLSQTTFSGPRLPGAGAVLSDRRTLSVVIGQRPALQLDAVSRELAAAGFEIRGTATSCEQLRRAIAALPPDVALVHAGLEPTAPLGFVADLRLVAPDTAIVVLIDDLSPCLAHAALAHEVDGVVLGEACINDLVQTLRRVAAGEAVYPGGWLHAAHRADGDSIEVLLSDRQRDVLELVAAGLGNSQIAAALQISPNTVKFHVRQIYQRLGVRNRVEATLLMRGEHRTLAMASPTT